MQIYDNFISYRRSESLAEVQNIYHALLRKGFSTFCDIYSLNAGRFDKNLIDTLDNCINYILVLSEHSLDRCLIDENDWLSLEISEALKKKKNIITVFVGNVEFPEYLPDSISDIRFYNAIKYDFLYFEGFIDCIITRFLATADVSNISDKQRDFVIKGTTLVKYIGSAPIVNVPDGIEIIGKNAFKDKTRITDVSLPDSLTTIDEGAFERCINISHITFPHRVRNIKKGAFLRCYDLSFVALNNDLEYIDSEAFGFCAKLKIIKFGSKVSFIDSSAFNNCNQLTRFYIVEDNPFYSVFDGILYNSTQTEVIRCPEGYDSDVVSVLPTVSALAAWSFSKCLNIIDIILPRGLTTVGAYAFNDCCNILSLTLGDSVSSFDVTALTGWNKTQRIVVSRRFNPLIKYSIDQKICEKPELEQAIESRTKLPAFVVVKTTFESHEEASKMAKMLLDNKYIASAQIHRLNVFYTWNDDFCNEDEVELSCITTGERYYQVEQFIKQHHSYECCQLICLPIAQTSEDFGNWISSCTETDN